MDDSLEMLSTYATVTHMISLCAASRVSIALSGNNEVDRESISFLFVNEERRPYIQQKDH